MATCCKNIPKCARVIAHDTVHSKVEEPRYLDGVINGPYVNLESEGMRRSDELLGDHRDGTLRHRNLGKKSMISHGQGDAG